MASTTKSKLTYMSSQPSSGPSFATSWDKEAACPNCAAHGLKIFYEVRGIPCHSTLLMNSPKDAVDYPRGDLRLGFCPSCGFVCNTLFDPTAHEYSQRCEESQGFSPTFNKFATELAKRYAKKYDLKDKVALEIGCGKGEWLLSLCEASGGRGIGIDPGYQPSRLQSEAMARMEWIIDFYGPKYAHLKADFIACRHTLEHIGPTLDFMRDIRKTVGDKKGVVLFFELPEVLRELEEGAFWDMYYEHCTYFSPGSLARVFRQAHFDVTHLSIEYDNQYIILDAVPTDRVTAPRLPLEDDMARLTMGVERFAAVTSAICKKWTDLCRGAHAKGEKVVIWGSGSKGVSFLTTLGLTKEVVAAVDINTYRQGKFMPGTGHEIVSPEALKQLKPDHVIVMNPIYVPEITAQLHGLGLRPTVHAL